jgi:hypothetical protein
MKAYIAVALTAVLFVVIFIGYHMVQADNFNNAMAWCRNEGALWYELSHETYERAGYTPDETCLAIYGHRND